MKQFLETKINYKRVLNPTFARPFPSTWCKIKKEIGTGGGGVLDLYEDSITKKKYVVKKTMKYKEKLLLHQYRNLEYLQKEKICHYFLCPLGLFQKNDKIMIAFTYLDNFVNLETILDKDMSILMDISKKIIKDLKLLHSKNMVHMDIKPSNIMVNLETKSVRFIDFGGAIIQKPHRKNYEAITWTDYFLSPEFKLQYKDNKKIVATFEEMKKNDIWALGKTLFYLFKNSQFEDYDEFNDFLNLSTNMNTNFFDLTHMKRKL